MPRVGITHTLAVKLDVFFYIFFDTRLGATTAARAFLIRGGGALFFDTRIFRYFLIRKCAAQAPEP